MKHETEITADASKHLAQSYCSCGWNGMKMEGRLYYLRAEQESHKHVKDAKNNE